MNNKIIAQVDELIRRGERVLETKTRSQYGESVDSGLLQGWRTSTLSFIQRTFGKEHVSYSNFEELQSGFSVVWDLQRGLGILTALRLDLEQGLYDDLNHTQVSDPFHHLERLFTKFHRIAVQLRSRHEDRPTLDVKDEYDVQDLCHALLKLFFEDVRPEEWTPSYAGSASRMDFFLKKENIAVEMKRSRKGLTAKKLGEELIVDIEKYSTYSGCVAIVCFVYDPEGLFPNPEGIENDLRRTEAPEVRVFIRPVH